MWISLNSILIQLKINEMQIGAYNFENLLVTMVLILFFEKKQMGKIIFIPLWLEIG